MYYWVRSTGQFAKFAEPCAIGWQGGTALPSCGPNNVTQSIPADATFYDDAFW